MIVRYERRVAFLIECAQQVVRWLRLGRTNRGKCIPVGLEIPRLEGPSFVEKPSGQMEARILTSIRVRQSESYALKSGKESKVSLNKAFYGANSPRADGSLKSTLAHHQWNLGSGAQFQAREIQSACGNCGRGHPTRDHDIGA